jgi:hypothetical protein
VNCTSRCVLCDQLYPVTSFQAGSASCQQCLESFPTDWDRFGRLLENLSAVNQAIERLQQDQGILPEPVQTYRTRTAPLFERGQRLYDLLSQPPYREWALEALRMGDLQSAGEAQPKRRVRLTNALMSEVWTRDAGVCVECGSTDDLQFDHIIPVSKGGATTSENLRILCVQCNARRGNRM